MVHAPPYHVVIVYGGVPQSYLRMNKTFAEAVQTALTNPKDATKKASLVKLAEGVDEGLEQALALGDSTILMLNSSSLFDKGCEIADLYPTLRVVVLDESESVKSRLPNGPFVVQKLIVQDSDLFIHEILG